MAHEFPEAPMDTLNTKIKHYRIKCLRWIAMITPIIIVAIIVRTCFSDYNSEEDNTVSIAGEYVLTNRTNPYYSHHVQINQISPEECFITVDEENNISIKLKIKGNQVLDSPYGMGYIYEDSICFEQYKFNKIKK